MRKTIAAVGITASLLAGSFVGAAVLPSGIGVAQEQTDADSTTETDGSAERGVWVRDTIDELVADDTITREQGDAVLAALEANRPERPRHGEHRARLGQHLETMAEIIGVEKDALAEALRDGTSPAEVAEANGVSTQSLIDALVAEGQARMATAVEDGKITQEQADQISEHLVERTTARVNGERPERPGRPGRPD